MSTEVVTDSQLALLKSLTNEMVISGLSHGTVRDFCQGSDYCPELCRYNNDLKDAQRYWVLKAILTTQPQGATLLEIGAGEPLVADILGRLGYRVIVVDPYEGAGNGPTSIEHFKNTYRNVEYVIDLFSSNLQTIEIKSVDCCYSISVIEHVPLHALSTIADGIQHFLRPAGSTVHAIDFVSAGAGADYHLEMFEKFAGLLGYRHEDIEKALLAAREDVDTYYLSAEAHNRWRGSVPYDQFPMRRVQSMQIVGLPIQNNDK